MSKDGRSKSGNSKKSALSLNEQDAALWKYLKHSVIPLKDKNRFEPHGDLESEFSSMVKKGKKKTPSISHRIEAIPASKPAQMPSYTPPVSEAKNRRRGLNEPAPALADFERRDVRKIITGNLPIDATLDLHGMTQNKAKPALKRFLRKHQQFGDKLVLVITGKGNSKRVRHQIEDDNIFYENTQEGGVLQYMVPNWLDESSFRDMVISYKTAHRSHGEEGALYIRLRKVR